MAARPSALASASPYWSSPQRVRGPAAFPRRRGGALTSRRYGWKATPALSTPSLRERCIVPFSSGRDRGQCMSSTSIARPAGLRWP